MAFVMNSTSCGANVTLPAAVTSGPITLFAAVYLSGSVTTWGRGIGLQKVSENQFAQLHATGDSTLQGNLKNAGNTWLSKDSILISTGTWYRAAVAMRTDRVAIKVNSNSLGVSGTGDISYWPGSTGVDKFVICTNAAGDGFADGASKWAHFGFYQGEWTDQQIADFCAGTLNPANSSLVTAYWDGSSLASQVGGLTLVNRGSNNITFDSDTGHGVPDYSGSAGITLQQVERGRGVLRGLGRGL